MPVYIMWENTSTIEKMKKRTNSLEWEQMRLDISLSLRRFIPIALYLLLYYQFVVESR